MSEDLQWLTLMSLFSSVTNPLFSRFTVNECEPHRRVDSVMEEQEELKVFAIGHYQDIEGLKVPPNFPKKDPNPLRLGRNIQRPKFSQPVA